MAENNKNMAENNKKIWRRTKINYFSRKKPVPAKFLLAQR